MSSTAGQSVTNAQSGKHISIICWATTIAVGSHALFSLLFAVEFCAALMILPGVIKSFEDFDATMPPLLVLVINVLSACRTYWFILPLPALGLFAADGWIFYRLFRNPLSRFLAATWFFMVLSAILVITAIIMAALMLPLYSFTLHLS